MHPVIIIPVEMCDGSDCNADEQEMVEGNVKDAEVVGVMTICFIVAAELKL